MDDQAADAGIGDDEIELIVQFVERVAVKYVCARLRSVERKYTHAVLTHLTVHAAGDDGLDGLVARRPGNERHGNERHGARQRHRRGRGMFYGLHKLHSFQPKGGALSAADTHGHQRAGSLTALKFFQSSEHQPRAGRSDRMA